MRTEINGQEGYVHWEYTEPDDDGYVDTFAYFRVSRRKLYEFDGSASCSPQDRFCKETGRKISLTRLLQNANLSREERRKVWQDYFNRGRQNGNG